MRKLMGSKAIVIPFVILLFSLAFRITNLDLIEFKTDEAVNLILASKFTPGGTVSSVGVLNPPLFNYLLWPLTLITLDPRIFSFLIAFFNSVAVVLFYLLTRKYYTEVIAFISSLFFAFSPWAILYSRKIWTQDLLVPFFILLLYSYHKIIIEKQKKFWALLVISSLFLIQLHEISVIFVVLFFMFLIKKQIIPDFKYFLIGAILGLIPFLPYLGYEIKNNYPDFKALVATKNKLSAQRSLSLFMRPLQIAGQGNFSFVLGQDLDTFAKKYPLANNLRRIFYFEYILIVLGIVTFLKKYKQASTLVYSSISLPFAYYFLKIEPFMHYSIIILPILFVFLGSAFEFLFSKKGLIKNTALIVLISLLGNSLLFNFSFLDLLKQQGYLRGDYGDSFKVSLNHVKHREFDELFLFQFVPLNYAFGYNPFAKMLYSTTPQQIPLIEDQLRKTGDPRLEQKLLAFYTKTPPALETLDTLRKKTRENLIYTNIYKVTLEDYLAKNYKKEYVSEKFDFRFFYPQHWKVLEVKDLETINVKGDSLILVIEKSKVSPFNTRYIQKGPNEQFKNELIAAKEVIKSIRFLSD